jgi:hypothetical protein
MSEAMKGIVIANLDRYEDIRLQGESLDDYFIITTSISLVHFLKNSNKKFINLWEYLDAQIIEESERLTLEINENFMLPNEEKINYHGIPINQVSKPSLLGFYKAVLQSCRSFERVTAQFEFEEIKVIENKNKVYREACLDESDILDGVIEFICQEQRIPVSYYRFRNQTTKSLRIPSFYTLEDLEEFSYQGTRNDKTRLLILLSYNAECDFDLVRELKKNMKINVDVVWRIRREQKDNNTESVPLLFFDDFKFMTDEELQLLCILKHCESEFFEGNKNLYAAPYAAIFQNDFIDFQFKKYFNDLGNIVADLYTFDRVCKFLVPDKVYFSNSWDYSVRNMMKRAVQLGCETYCTIHGGLSDEWGYNLRKIDIDNYFVNGADNSDGLVNLGQKPESIKVVGSIRMDRWNERVESEIRAQCSQKQDIANGEESFTVTFFTSNGFGFEGNATREDKYLETIQAILKLAQKYPNISFKVKPHPIYDFYLFEKLIANGTKQNNFDVIGSHDLLKAILETDLAVLVNTISNVALEISISKKHIIFLKDAHFLTKSSESAIEKGGIKCAYSVEELEKLIINYKHDKDLVCELEKRRLDFLNLALARLDEKAIDRSKKIIMETLPKIKRDSDDSLFLIIEWLRHIIISERGLPFPSVKNRSRLPSQKNLLNWIYALCCNWSIYYGKGHKVSSLFWVALKDLSLKVNVSKVVMFEKIAYANLRQIYLDLGLHNKQTVRRLLSLKRKYVGSVQNPKISMISRV